MKSFLHLLAFLCTAASATAQDYIPGLRDLHIPAAADSRPLDGLLWYPAANAAALEPIYDSKVWEAPLAAREAAPATGPFPLVVLSHGMYGNALNQAWLAEALARQGFVVAAISHPGTSTWSREPDLSRQLWQRPRDISRVIDHLLAAPQLAALADPARIYMAGHSLGGFTAALLAGARYDADRFSQMCDTLPDDLVCGILKGWKIAETPEDRAHMQAELSDPRIRAFALFDLGGTQSFSEDSLARITRPMLVYGAPIMNSGLTLDIESRALVQALSAADVRYVEPQTLSHFDFLGQCQPDGLAILAAEAPGDEIICRGGGMERAAKHQQIITEVAAFFHSN
ncbi:alpha/beta hydrolase family protein [Leisingera sp. S232]|uniref:alpha/beta hydrolase family protein n=1 Tax=Leisingera sp. S232 TaxID=3415132 RepID=UPI003C7DC6D6